MGVPNKFDRLGIITVNKLPAGYLAAEFLEFSQQINTPYQVQDYLAPKEFYIDLKLWRNYPNGGMWLSLIGYNYNEQYIQRISIAGSDYNAQQHNDWACQWVAPNNRGGFKYQGQVDFSRRNKVLYKNSTVDINGIKTESPLNGTGSHEGGAVIFINQPGNYATMQLYRASYAENNIKVFDYVPCITSQGQAVLYNKVDASELAVTSLSIGLTIDQAHNLSKLPVIEAGTLTVSLPWEAQWDVGVQNALSIATTNGWTIAVQYRDPEVATANIPISFLESTGTQYIDAGLRYSAHDTYSQTLDLSITDKNHEGSTGVNLLGWVTTKNGVYQMLDIGTTPIGDRDIIYNKFSNGTRSLYVNGSEAVTLTTSNVWVNIIAGIFSLGNNNNTWFNTSRNLKAKLYSAKFMQNDALARYMIPALTSTGTPCLYDRVTKQPFYNNGTGVFIAGFDTVEQARGLATLPDVTAVTDTTKKSLTVSLPWEAQLVITGVPAALQVASARGWIITVQYRDLEADNAYYNKYVACTTRADIEAVNPDYINDLTADGEWVYPLPNLASFNLPYQEKAWANGKLKKWQVPLPKLTPVPSWWFSCPTLEYMDLYAPEAKSLNQPMRWCGNVTYCKVYAPKATVMNDLVTYNSKLKEIEINTPSITNAQGAFFRLYSLERLICAPDIFHNVTKGTDMYLCNYKLIDFPTSYPALSIAPGMFDSCEIPGAAAIEVLNSIPAHTDGAEHAITLGIHIDYQDDVDIDAAVTAAEEKGWTVSVQWNGTATASAASTFGLRNPSVYAKLGITERPDGTTEPMLNWGHYVTNWEENGYQEFSSLEEAQTHFNINQTEEV